MSVGRRNGANNGEGSLGPTTSAWGQALRANVSQLIDQPLPIGKHVRGLPSYNGTVGGLVVVAASFMPVVAQQGYYGDAPQYLQPTVDAPDPWNRT